MKVLSYSDNHIRDTGSFQPWNSLTQEGVSYELKNIIRGHMFIAATIDQFQPDVVVGHGDVVQTTEFQTAQTLHGIAMCYSALKEVTDRLKIPHYLLLGNHDILSENQNIYSTSILRGYGVVLIDSYRVIDGLALIPYSSNLGRVTQELRDSEMNRQVMAIYTHLDFNGARYDSGQISESPISPFLDKVCISGDIHLQQQVGNVHYVGSLIQNRFNRPNLDGVGGVLILDTESGQITRIQNTWSKHYIRVRDQDIESPPPPDTCVLKIITSKPRELIEQQYSAYERIIVSEPNTGVQDKVTYNSYARINPREALRTHISSERPGAVETFDRYVKD